MWITKSIWKINLIVANCNWEDLDWINLYEFDFRMDDKINTQQWCVDEKLKRRNKMFDNRKNVTTKSGSQHRIVPTRADVRFLSTCSWIGSKKVLHSSVQALSRHLSTSTKFCYNCQEEQSHQKQIAFCLILLFHLKVELNHKKKGFSKVCASWR